MIVLWPGVSPDKKPLWRKTAGISRAALSLCLPPGQPCFIVFAGGAEVYVFTDRGDSPHTKPLWRKKAGEQTRCRC